MNDEILIIKKRIGILAIIIFLLLAVSIIGILFAQGQEKTGTLCAEIYRDDELLETIDLSNVEENYTERFEYVDESGTVQYNIISVSNGEIGICEASCPDKLCVNMGTISNSLMPITCLPNHLVIRIVETENRQYDGLAY